MYIESSFIVRICRRVPVSYVFLLPRTFSRIAYDTVKLRCSQILRHGVSLGLFLRFFLGNVLIFDYGASSGLQIIVCNVIGNFLSICGGFEEYGRIVLGSLKPTVQI